MPLKNKDTKTQKSKGPRFNKSKAGKPVRLEQVAPVPTTLEKGGKVGDAKEQKMPFADPEYKHGDPNMSLGYIPLAQSPVTEVVANAYQYTVDDLRGFSESNSYFPTHHTLESSTTLDAIKQATKLHVDAYLRSIKSNIDESERIEAARSVITNDTKQNKEVVRFSHWLTESQLEYIKEKAPHILIVSGYRATYHPHPILNLDRAYAENAAYEYIIFIFKQRGVAEYWIVDIGGNASRHHKNKRTNVHSCCPQITDSDVTRAINHDQAPNRCEHTAQECVCVMPSAYLAVDSLYYLTPLDIAILIERSTQKLLVAVVHEFKDAFGSYANGEAVYHLIGEDEVAMNVNGNPGTYTHSAMAWLRQPSQTFEIEGKQVTLCWSILRPTMEHTIYYFTTTYKTVKKTMYIEPLLQATISNPNYYGRVLTGPLGESGETEIIGDKIDVKTLKIWSFGSSVAIYDAKQTTPMYTPKGLVACAAAHMTMKKRTPDTLAQLAGNLRHYAKKLNIPAEFIPQAISVATCIGFIQHLQAEISNMHAYIKPTVNLTQTHTDALNLTFKTVWTAPKVAAVAAVAACVVAPVLAYTPLGSLALPLATVVAKSIIPKAVVSYSIYSALAKPSQKDKTDEIFQDYHSHRASTLVEHNCATRIISLRSTPPPKTIHELLQMELDPTARLLVDDHSVVRDVGVMKPYGLYSTDNIPIFAESSTHSEISTCVERGLKMMVYHTPAFNLDFFNAFRISIMMQFSSIFKTMRTVVPTDFEKWNCRFDKGRQAKQRAAYEQCRIWATSGWKTYIREMFIKIEAQLKSTDAGVVKFACRMIQGALAEFNVTLGPYFHNYSEQLKTTWSVDNTVGPIYASGMSAEKLGACFERAWNHYDDCAILEGDFSRFDTTIHKKLLQLEADINHHLGASQLVTQTLRRAIDTKGYGKFGTMYSIEGTRHSGDPQTSCGNTTLQVISHLYCLSHHLQITIRECMERFTILALGDDVLIMGSHHDLINYDSKRYLARLGFDFVPKLHTGPQARYSATFCSGRFYPCVNELGNRVVVHGPNIGRVYSKIGYYVNPPRNMDHLRLVRGDALSRRLNCSMLPCIRLNIEKLLDLTKSVSKVFYTPEARHRLQNEPNCGQMYYPSDETYEMTYCVYNIGRSEEKQYAEKLEQVISLPHVLNFSPLRHAAVVDGDLSTTEYHHSESSISLTPLKIEVVDE
jgi:hypothetical protein